MQCLKAWCIKLKHLGEGKAEEEISQIISYSLTPCFPCAERLSSKSQNVLKYIYIARIFLGCTLPRLPLDGFLLHAGETKRDFSNISQDKKRCSCNTVVETL